jgi:glycosyltransferase involved in cell wall biosynthesis
VNRLLLISYYAPPYGAVGSFRPIQFLTHLPSHGWECTVLTTTETSYRRDGHSLDASLGERFADSRMIRVPAVGPYAGPQPVSLSDEWHALSNPILRTARQAAATVLSPDRHITWLPLAVLRALGAAHDSNLLYAQGPPFTNHIVGMCLKRLTGTPLISMFEDPWIGMDHRVWHSRAQRRIQMRQEHSVIRNSDLILTGTDGFRDDLLDRHGSHFSEKILTLRMGYMGLDAHLNRTPQPSASPTTDPIRLVYTGSLRRSPQYDATALLQAFVHLRLNHPEIADGLRLTVYGNVDPYYRKLSLNHGLDSSIDFAGFVSHEQAVAAMEEADGLVLLIGADSPGLRMYTSGKIYQYMSAHRPILALVPSDGEAATLVRRHKLGLVIPPDDPMAIVDALVRFVRDRHELTSQLGDTSEYTAEAIVDQAADIFGRVARS